MGMQGHFRGKVVLITGASSGIGEELAWQLACAGALVTLAARRTQRLALLSEKIAAAGGTQCLVVECDVTKDSDPERAVAETLRARGRLDIVFANAGFGVVGAIAKLSLDDYRRQLETNVFGVLRTLLAALPEVQRNSGQIVLLGSVAGWISTPGSSPYAMSKFAVRALANAITPELASGGVTVTLISPGFVESDIRRVDNLGEVHAEAPDPIPQWLVMRREPAVRQMLRAVARGRREVIITRHGKIFVALERFAPWIIRAAARRMAARGGYRSEATSDR
ncbi:MAG TPA: SDR family NAD(P)-dependent oxidoreductase [Steroidobacteraceae bacterium]|nr:SDR family NAD(P)-dependent oxidoreductase [Steroidobacteraceae bacterium]